MGGGQGPRWSCSRALPAWALTTGPHSLVWLRQDTGVGVTLPTGKPSTQRGGGLGHEDTGYACVSSLP